MLEPLGAGVGPNETQARTNDIYGLMTSKIFKILSLYSGECLVLKWKVGKIEGRPFMKCRE